jgi:hypothetical protein
MSSRVVLATLAAAVFGAACSTGTAPASEPWAASDAVVRSVVPIGGATGVNPAEPITVVFNHSMMLGAEALIMLHRDSVTGPEVSGTASWSADRTQLTFTPAAPLAAHTTYVLHFSPNLEDAGGSVINWGRCAGPIGGQAVSPGAFHGGMMGGGPGGGMGPWGNGPGWQPGSGTWGYGMSITFTTA